MAASSLSSQSEPDLLDQHLATPLRHDEICFPKGLWDRFDSFMWRHLREERKLLGAFCLGVDDLT